MESFGVRVGLRATQAWGLEELVRRLPPGWQPARGPVDRLFSLVVGGNGTHSKVRRFHLLYENWGLAARSSHLELVLDLFESRVELYAAEMTTRFVFVHAGAVGWQGRAIVLPGSTGSGKTTLTAALVRAGAEYYSDEFAVVDKRGYVHPYTRPLTLRVEAAGRSERRSAAELGGRAGSSPLRVGLVVATEYSERESWRPRAIARGEGVLELLQHAIPARRDPKRTLTTLERALRGARVVQGSRGEASGAAPLVLRELKQEDDGA